MQTRRGTEVRVQQQAVESTHYQNKNFTLDYGTFPVSYLVCCTGCAVSHTYHYVYVHFNVLFFSEQLYTKYTINSRCCFLPLIRWGSFL